MSVNNVVFSLTPHKVILGKQTIEVRDRDNGKLLGTITQGDDINTIRFLTKHQFLTRIIVPTVDMTVLEVEVNEVP